MQPVRSSRLSGVDGLLAALAVVGLALLIFLLPRLHPNAAASFALGVEGAEAAAAQFLTERGYAVDELDARVFFTSSPTLLDTLQRTLGRTDARTALLTHGEPLTGFRWQVDWSEPFDLDSDEGRGPSLTRFTVWLTQDGQPFELQVRSGGTRTTATDARALRRALYGDSPVEVALDSLPAGALRFEILPDSGLAAGTPGRAWQARDRIMLGMAEQWQQEAASGERAPTRAPLSATAAIAIAEAHLAGTLPGALRLEPYWVYPVPEAGSDVARVRFIAPSPVFAQSVVADVEVDAHGVLRSLRYAPSEAPDGAPLARGDRAAANAMSVDVSPTSMVPIVRWGLFAVIVLVIAVLFLRRLAARAVDARAALIDAGIVATATLAWSFLVFPSYYLQFGAPMTTALLFTLVGGLLWAAGLGLLVFVGAATTDSLARSVFVEKLDALALVRNGAWMNRPVGLSLLRGVLGGLALAGLPVLLWLVTPSRAVYAGDTFSFIQPDVLVAPHLFLSTLWVAFVILHYGLLGTGALLARWKSHVGPVVVGLGVLGALAIVGPVGQGVDPGWMRWVFAGAYALGVAALFWRTDALTAFWAVVFSIWLYRFAVVAIADASPADGEAGIVVLGLAVVAGIGAVALRMDQTGQAVQRVEPSYLTELATRERLEREVEIAREVQRSFLPATMPDVPGLDLAATCVPAEEVGGDYYDLVPLEDGPDGARRLAVVVGDVSGKGIQAAFYMTLVKGFLRTLCRTHTSPAAVLTRLNRLFCENVPRGAFISMIYGVFDLGTGDLDGGTFTFARAGHNPLILKRSGHARADLLQPSGLAIGLSAGPLFDDVLVDHTLDLLPGDTLVFYTDGFSEAVDNDRALYTDARLATVTADAMHEVADRPAAQLLGSLVADVRAFAADDGLRDDMTMVVVRVDPALVHPTGNGAATVVEA